MIAALAGALLGANFDPPGTEIVIAFTKDRFEPARIELRRGARVTFHNMDKSGEVLTVVSEDGSFESRPLSRGAEWSHRFKSVGEHGFHLREHTETKGKVTVQ